VSTRGLPPNKLPQADSQIAHHSVDTFPYICGRRCIAAANPGFQTRLPILPRLNLMLTWLNPRGKPIQSAEAIAPAPDAFLQFLYSRLDLHRRVRRASAIPASPSARTLRYSD
jgi:hypothetical protein